MPGLPSVLEPVRDSPKQVVEAVVRQAREADVPFMAGSIAYQAFVSLVPILVLLFVLVSVVGDERLAEQVVALTEGFLPRTARTLVRNAVASRDGVGGAGASVIGLVTLAWGSLTLFRGLDKAFSEVYGTAGESSFVDRLREGAVVLVALGAGVVGTVVVMATVAAFGGTLAWLSSLLALVAGLTLAFLPMYRVFPDTDLGWVDALPGAAFAAVGWVALQALFQVYVLLSGRADSSSVLGAVLLLLVWLYLSGVVLLLAAVVNAVLLGETDTDAVTDSGTDAGTTTGDGSAA